MKHNIKFNHEGSDTILGSMGSESNVATINKKVIDEIQPFLNSADCIHKSHITEKILDIMTLEEIAYLATEAIFNNIKKVIISVPSPSTGEKPNLIN
jgi:hypothetical protein